MPTPNDLKTMDLIWERMTGVVGFRYTGTSHSSLIQGALETTEPQQLYCGPGGFDTPDSGYLPDKPDSDYFSVIYE